MKLAKSRKEHGWFRVNAYDTVWSSHPWIDFWSAPIYNVGKYIVAKERKRIKYYIVIQKECKTKKEAYAGPFPSFKAAKAAYKVLT